MVLVPEGDSNNTQGLFRMQNKTTVQESNPEICFQIVLGPNQSGASRFYSKSYKLLEEEFPSHSVSTIFPDTFCI